MEENTTDIKFDVKDEINIFIRPAPNWLIRWGSTLFGLFIILFLFTSWLIRYPDIIPSAIVITSDNPPVRLFSRSSGKVMNVFVKDGEAVLANELLAELQSDAQLKDVIHLENLVQKIENDITKDKLTDIHLVDTLTLGNIQNTYAAIAQQWEDLLYFSQSTIKANRTKIAALKEQKSYHDSLIYVSKRQREFMKDEMEIHQFDQKRNRQLNENGLVSDRDAEQIDLSFLQQQQQFEGSKANVFNLILNQQQIDLEILNLSQTMSDELKYKKMKLRENIHQIKNEISTWKQLFLVAAPIAGIISSTKILRQFQFIPSNEEIFTIVPTQSSDSKILCKGTLPIMRSGKIKIGMKVIIRLENFPYEEYGTIAGVLSHISPVPENDQYHIAVTVENPIVTNFGQELEFREELKGVAEIITQDKRLLERIFENFRKLLV